MNTKTAFAVLLAASVLLCACSPIDAIPVQADLKATLTTDYGAQSVDIVGELNGANCPNFSGSTDATGQYGERFLMVTKSGKQQSGFACFKTGFLGKRWSNWRVFYDATPEH